MVVYSIPGAMVGAVGGAQTGGGNATLIVGAIGLGLGYLFGDGRARDLRRQAQLALCHVEIELNPRGP